MGFFGTIAKGIVGLGKVALTVAGVSVASAKKAVVAETHDIPTPPPPPPPPIQYNLPNYEYSGGGSGGGPINAFREPQPSYNAPSAPRPVAGSAPRKAAKKAKKVQKKAAKKAKKAAKKAAKAPKFGSPAWQKKYGKKKKKG